MLTLPSYVLITPARNEAQFIEITIRSVIAQSVLPLRWVVVSDGSSDGTDEIVQRYAAAHPWIELIRLPDRGARHFAGKVHAFNAGYARIADLPYQCIGSIDADISFDKDYFAFLLSKLAADQSLGLVGTPFAEKSGRTYDYRFVSLEHVSGACQLFRRECFENIGGYLPVKGGGIDHIAVITARMKGWKTRTFTEKTCIHHRDLGSALYGRIRVRFRDGMQDYALGGHPLWQLCRSVYQMSKRPFLVGGLMVLAGYFWAASRNTDRPVSADLVAFRRREQIARLRQFFSPRHTAAQPSTL